MVTQSVSGTARKAPYSTNMKFQELNEASAKEQSLGEQSGRELAHAMDDYAQKLWNQNVDIQRQFKGQYLDYLKACSVDEKWRKDFFSKFMKFVEQSFEETIQELIR
jgi:hypothetical protein